MTPRQWQWGSLHVSTERVGCVVNDDADGEREEDLPETYILNTDHLAGDWEPSSGREAGRRGRWREEDGRWARRRDRLEMAGFPSNV